MKKTNIKLLWSMLARSSAIDINTKQLSIFNMLDDLTVTKNKIPEGSQKGNSEVEKINVNIDFVFVMQLERDDISGDFDDNLKLSIVGPNGEVIAENALPTHFDDQKKRLIYTVNFGGMTVTTSGAYTYSISRENDGANKELGETSVMVRVV